MPLVGKKSLLKCFISGYATIVLFDSQASLLDRSWRETFIPNHPVCPLEELLDPDESLNLYAANGQKIPYDGWVGRTAECRGRPFGDQEQQVTGYQCAYIQPH